MVTWLHGTHMVQNFGFEKWILAGQTVAQCARTPILYLLVTLFKNCSQNFDLSINMALVNGGFLHYTNMKKFMSV